MNLRRALKEERKTASLTTIELEEVLIESQIVRIEVDLVFGIVDLLFDCRVAFSGVDFDAAGLRLIGVESIDSSLFHEEPAPRARARVIGIASTSFERGRFKTHVMANFGADVDIVHSAGSLAAAKLVSLNEVADYTSDPETMIEQATPSWAHEIQATTLKTFAF